MWYNKIISYKQMLSLSHSQIVDLAVAPGLNSKYLSTGIGIVFCWNRFPKQSQIQSVRLETKFNKDLKFVQLSHIILAA